MKTALTIFVILFAPIIQADEMSACKGSVLQRRFALVQFGQVVDDHSRARGVLPDICTTPVVGVADRVPDLLKGTWVCGSSEEGAVYYSCQIPSKDPPVIENCRYSLADQSVSCENRTMVTTFE